MLAAILQHWFTKGFSNYSQKCCHTCMIWTPFVSTALKQFRKYLGIDSRQHCAYHPSSGGAVERENGTLQETRALDLLKGNFPE